MYIWKFYVSTFTNFNSTEVEHFKQRGRVQCLLYCNSFNQPNLIYITRVMLWARSFTWWAIQLKSSWITCPERCQLHIYWIKSVYTYFVHLNSNRVETQSPGLSQPVRCFTQLIVNMSLCLSVQLKTSWIALTKVRLTQATLSNFNSTRVEFEFPGLSRLELNAILRWQFRLGYAKWFNSSLIELFSGRFASTRVTPPRICGKITGYSDTTHIQENIVSQFSNL